MKESKENEDEGWWKKLKLKVIRGRNLDTLLSCSSDRWGIEAQEKSGQTSNQALFFNLFFLLKAPLKRVISPWMVFQKEESP